MNSTNRIVRGGLDYKIPTSRIPSSLSMQLSIFSLIDSLGKGCMCEGEFHKPLTFWFVCLPRSYISLSCLFFLFTIQASKVILPLFSSIFVRMLKYTEKFNFPANNHIFITQILRLTFYNSCLLHIDKIIQPSINPFYF